VDTFSTAKPGEGERQGTVNGFKALGANKIDFIFVSAPLRALSSKIIRTRRDDGGFPSDHFPVEAVVAWEKSSTD